MLVAEAISQEVPALKGISLDVAPGKVTGIIGPNGAGKTSLIKILAGIRQAEQGQVLLDNKPLSQYHAASRARAIAYLEQHCFVHWPLSVEQVVALGRFVHRNNPENTRQTDRDAVAKVVQSVGIQKLLSRNFMHLSGGERMRVLLARALAVGAPYLLVDEPIASLDLHYQYAIMDLLVAQKQAGVGVAMIVHDLSIAAQYCDYLYVIQEGELIDSGIPQVVLTPELLLSVFKIRASVESSEHGIRFYFDKR